MTSASSPDYDAIIVGARCAGAATALLLARRGLRVLAIDRGRYGSDTISTHALMRAGVRQLSRWGVLHDIKAAGTPVVRTTAFHYGDKVVEVRIKPQNDIDGLYAPRRTVIGLNRTAALRERSDPFDNRSDPDGHSLAMPVTSRIRSRPTESPMR